MVPKRATHHIFKVQKLSGGIRVKILEVVDWSQLPNQPSQLESAAATASSGFFKVLEAAGRA